MSRADFDRYMAEDDFPALEAEYNVAMRRQAGRMSAGLAAALAATSALGVSGAHAPLTVRPSNPKKKRSKNRDKVKAARKQNRKRRAG